ncbi:carbohydrate ABC transporter permease [Paenibacillus antri]|uniref:Carbohydrate ABC transporter permease n=1 Tax=Paenibacillus antri TaxID=2582848 RepID=A0A5R9G679_9BACL|nr:carbohydrate ABC transporter permease [Paenibacillus antri]TLS51281.1 carbohydrate ABC transporter permease [Paenibacillus antri]
MQQTKTNPGQVAINLMFAVVSLLMILPLVLVVSISVSEEKSLLTNGYRFIPESLDFTAYKLILQTPGVLLNAYGVTILVTIAGTILSLLMTAMIGYAISRRDYRYGRITTFYIFFTMLFSGGLVPSYILITQYLHLKDTIWALIIPYLLSPFNIMLMKGFLQKIPGEIIESCKMDGAGELRIFFRIILPLSTPALATLGLFISFMYWNDWWLGLLYIDNQNLVPLQLMLYRMMNTIDFLSSNLRRLNVMIDLASFPSLSSRMAMAVLAAGPMMFVFPFFQRYFVSGLTVGSLKG